MLTRGLWLCYLFFSYVVLPVRFRVRFGFWPYAYSWKRRDLYSAVDLLYGGALSVYSVALLTGARPVPISTAGGASILIVGWMLQVWAVLALGAHWRFGQDSQDTRVRFVFGGPYRWLGHPIYLGLVVVAVGQGTLTGLDWRSGLLVGATMVYFVFQAPYESRSWAARRKLR